VFAAIFWSLQAQSGVAVEGSGLREKSEKEREVILWMWLLEDPITRASPLMWPWNTKMDEIQGMWMGLKWLVFFIEPLYLIEELHWRSSQLMASASSARGATLAGLVGL
jgi:hypothetical protein